MQQQQHSAFALAIENIPCTGQLQGMFSMPLCLCLLTALLRPVLASVLVYELRLPPSLLSECESKRNYCCYYQWQSYCQWCCHHQQQRSPSCMYWSCHQQQLPIYSCHASCYVSDSCQQSYFSLCSTASTTAGVSVSCKVLSRLCSANIHSKRKKGQGLSEARGSNKQAGESCLPKDSSKFHLLQSQQHTRLDRHH